MKTIVQNTLLDHFAIASLEDANFTVSSLEDALSTVNEITNTMKLFL
jgi:hypothetical protein